MSENHLWSHFSPFQINTQLLFLLIFSQNGCRRPFWMTENHFRWHFSPFQINTQLLFFWFCSQNGCRRPFWMTENTFDGISRHFRSICSFSFYKMAAGGHLGWPKITFNRIFRHLRSIRNFYLFLILFTKWLPAAILDDRKSLSIAFLAISDQYGTFIFLRFCSQNDCRRPFWMTENHFQSHFSPFQINTQLLFVFIFSQKGCRRPFWMTENHCRSHFSPFQINTQLLVLLIFFTKWLPAAILDDRKSHSPHSSLVPSSATSVETQATSNHFCDLNGCYF